MTWVTVYHENLGRDEKFYFKLNHIFFSPIEMNEIDIREILQKKFDTDETESSQDSDNDTRSRSPSRSPRQRPRKRSKI